MLNFLASQNYINKWLLKERKVIFMALKLEQSRIDEAIDMALEKREKNQESVCEIIDDFIIVEVVDYLIEDDKVILKVSEAAGDEDQVLIAKKDDITLAVHEARHFLKLEIGYDWIAKYLWRAISTLSERSERIKVVRPASNDEYEISLK